MTRVLVSAWVGSGNLGDELILRATLRLLAASGAEVVVPSLDPAATEGDHAVRSLHHLDVARIRRAVTTSDLVIFGGGGLVQDATSGWSPQYQALRPLLARLSHVPVVGLGLGADPLRLRTSRATFRAALGAAAALGARDAASARVLHGLGLPRVTTTADLVLTLPRPDVSPRDDIVACLRAQPPAPGLVPGRWRSGHTRAADLAIALAGGLTDLARTSGCAVRLVLMEPRRDAPFAEAVAARMAADTEVVAPDLGGVLAEFARARLVVTTRYHGAVAAALTGRPAVLLGYAPKVRALAAELPRSLALLANRPDAIRALPRAASQLLAGSSDDDGALGGLVARANANAELLAAVLTDVHAMRRAGR